MRTTTFVLSARALVGPAVSVLLAALPAAGAGQAARDAGILRLYQAGREVGRETFVRTPGALETETAIPVLGVRLSYRTSYGADGALQAFEAQIRRLVSDSLVRSYELTVSGDSLRLVQTDAARAPRAWSTAARADAVVGSQSIAVYADLVRRAGGRDTVFRVWSPELDAASDLTVQFRGDTAVLEWQGIPFVATVGLDGRLEALEVSVQRVRVERAHELELPPLEGLQPPAADYGAPPGAPYQAEEVRIPVRSPGADAFELAGTLTLPRAGSAPYPAVITITGSGPQDRDENLWPLVPTYRPFRQIAERLAREGIAVLRVDDRGAGASGGRRDSATMADFADDLRAQLAWLRARPDIAADRIALVGHSEGGVVGPMVAAADPQLRAVVIMAGTAKTGVQVLHDQLTWPIESAPDLSAERKAALTARALASLYSDTASLGPWMRHFRSYDPLPTARRVAQPVLILHGALDRQVTVGQADTLAAAMREAGNRDVTVRVFPRLNHLFLVSPTDGSPAEYGALEDTDVSTEVLGVLAHWLRDRLSRDRQ